MNGGVNVLGPPDPVKAIRFFEESWENTYGRRRLCPKHKGILRIFEAEEFFARSPQLNLK
jgi:hypothetical protein